MKLLNGFSREEIENYRLIRKGNKLLAKALRDNNNKYQITKTGKYIIQNGVKRVQKHFTFERVKSAIHVFANSRVGTLVVCGVLCLGLFASAAFASTVKKAFINVKGEGQIACKYMGNTVADVLAQNGIILKDNDVVYPSLYSTLSDGDVISVMPSRNVILAIGNKTFTYRTTEDTIAGLLREQGIALTGSDVLVQNPQAAITDGMQISILKGSKVVETVDTKIPYIETKRSVANLNAGETRVAQKGVNGIRREVYEVTYQNGKVIKKILVSNNVIQNPVNKVLEFGGASATLASRDNIRTAISGSKSEYKQYAYERCKSYGWDNSKEFNALVQLWNEESGWRVNADNPNSSAYGIPQALPGSKMGANWQTDYKTQINWGLRYINGRYGSPSGALAAKHSKGWY